MAGNYYIKMQKDRNWGKINGYLLGFFLKKIQGIQKIFVSKSWMNQMMPLNIPEEHILVLV